MKFRFFNQFGRKKTRATLLNIMLVLGLSVSGFNQVWADDTYRVRSSDNLNSIVTRHYRSSGLTKSQLMVGVLSRNPRAFKGGNINFLLRGKRLVLPNVEEFKVISVEQAKEILSLHASYYRRGITGNLSTPTLDDFSELPDDLNVLNAKREAQKEKLTKLENEREQLKVQLEALTQDKIKRDKILEELEAQLKQSSQQQVPLDTSSTAKSRMEEVLSSEKRKRLLNEQVDKRTRKLQENNQALQKRLQETRSELAENTRENITLERELGALKGKPQPGVIAEPSNSITSKVNEVTPQAVNDAKADDGEIQEQGAKLSKDVDSSVAADIGKAKQTDKSLDSASAGLLEKLAWLFSVLAVFAGLWWLLRYFLNSKKQKDLDDDAEIYATPAFESTEDLDVDYEEDSLETSIKLDVARAYIEADDRHSAYEMLQEVIAEGSEEQQQEARDILAAYTNK